MTDKGQVTQADRDAVQAFHREVAAELLADINSKGPFTFGDNNGNDADAIHRAFASHRIASTAKLEAERDALRVALEWYADSTNYNAVLAQTTYGLWFDRYAVVNDEGKRARQSLLANQEKG